MATKIFIAEDGSHHTTKAAAEAHEVEAGLLDQVKALEGKKAKDILAWFSTHFRVPKTRKPRTPKAVPTPTAPATSATAATSAKKAA